MMQSRKELEEGVLLLILNQIKENIGDVESTNLAVRSYETFKSAKSVGEKHEG